MRPARVVRQRYDERGAPTYDVLDAYGGLYKGARIIQQAGGGADDYVHTPPVRGEWEGTAADIHVGENAEVLIAFPPGRNPRPYIIGALANPRSSRHFTEESTARSPDEDLDARTSLGDTTYQHNGTRITYRQDGTLGLDTASWDRPLKVHVGRGQFIRIAHSEYDDEGELTSTHPVTERVPLGSGLNSYLGAQLVAKVNELQAQVSALATQLQQAGVSASSAGDPGAALAASLSGQTPPTFTPAASPGDELLSAAFRISTKTKAEEE